MKSFTSRFVVPESAYIGYRDLFAFVNISQSMDRVSRCVLVLALLCVVITSVVDTACFEEDSSSTFISINREGVCLKDAEILLSSILIWVDVVYREEPLPLVFAKGIDLLVDSCS
jgi:hypothetical protein